MIFDKEEDEYSGLGKGLPDKLSRGLERHQENLQLQEEMKRENYFERLEQEEQRENGSQMYREYKQLRSLEAALADEARRCYTQGNLLLARNLDSGAWNCHKAMKEIDKGEVNESYATSWLAVYGSRRR